jgi:peptidoglycan/LPS O-acetylase OafA/YrhL
VIGCSSIPALRRYAEWGPLRRLGRISYSAYLIHGTVLILVATPLIRINPSVSVRTAMIFLVGMPLAPLVATGLNRLIEIPAPLCALESKWHSSVLRTSTPR